MMKKVHWHVQNYFSEIQPKLPEEDKRHKEAPVFTCGDDEEAEEP